MQRVSGRHAESVERKLLADGLVALIKAARITQVELVRGCRSEHITAQRVSAWTSAENVPSEQNLDLMLRVLLPLVRAHVAPTALAADELREQTWRQRRAAAEQSSPRLGRSPGRAGQPPGQRIAECGPDRLGVDPCARSSGAATDGPSLPPYIARAADTDLRSLVAHSAKRPGFGLLIGPPASGKARSSWEAIRRVPDRRLWCPLELPGAASVLEDFDRLAPGTVVWLGDLSELAALPDGDELCERLFRSLCDPNSRPLLVLATMWPERWELLRAGPPRPEHRSLRALVRWATVIDVPVDFDDHELGHLARAATTDERLDLACRSGTRKVAQFLSGAAEVVRRYRHADTAVRALIDAAIDARRLGHGGALRGAFLQAAAPGYMAQDWDVQRDDWFESSMAYAARLTGASSLLTRVRPLTIADDTQAAIYRLAPVIEHLGMTERLAHDPPATFWDAAIKHAHLDSDAGALALAALERGRIRRAYQFIIEREVTDRSLASEVAVRRATAGRWDDAEHIAQIAAGRGDGGLVFQMLSGLMAYGSAWEGIERLLRIAATSSDRGELLRVVATARPASDTGEPTVAGEPVAAEVMTPQRWAEAERLAAIAAEFGDRGMAFRLLVMRCAQLGQWSDGERLATLISEPAVRAAAYRTLADACAQFELWDRAGDFAQQAATLVGDGWALRVLARRLITAGRHSDGTRITVNTIEHYGCHDVTAEFVIAALADAGEWGLAEAIAVASRAAGDDGYAASIVSRRRVSAVSSEFRALVVAPRAVPGPPPRPRGPRWWRRRGRAADQAADGDQVRPLASVGLSLDDLGEARQSALQLPAGPERASALRNIAGGYARLGRWVEAEDAARLAEQDVPSGWPIRVLAREMAEAGEWAGAERLAREHRAMGDRGATLAHIARYLIAARLWPEAYRVAQLAKRAGDGGNALQELQREAVSQQISFDFAAAADFRGEGKWDAIDDAVAVAGSYLDRGYSLCLVAELVARSAVAEPGEREAMCERAGVIARAAAVAGDGGSALASIAHIFVDGRLFDGAERAAVASIAAGYSHGVTVLVESMIARGDRAGAESVRMFGLDAAGVPSERW